MHTPLRNLLISAVLLLIAAGAGCAKNRMEQLSDRAEKFNHAIRWSSLRAASMLVAQENRRTVLGKLSQRMNAEQVVDFAIVDLGVHEDKEAATVLVEFSFYPKRDQTLQYRQEIQEWKHLDGDWRVVGSRAVDAPPP